jgi:zinc protease
MTTKPAVSFFFVLLIPCAVAASAAPQQEHLVFPGLSQARLLNDLQTYVAATPYLGDAMTIGIVIRYGSAFDLANKGGVASLTSQMIAKATLDKTAKDIQDELKYLNASLDVRCDWDGIRFLLRGQSATFERSLLLLYQIICEAKFNEEDFAQAKGALLQQLQAPQDARQQVRGQLDAELFRGTTYGRPLRGSLASVQNIAIGDVRYFYRRYFSPDQASLVVVGTANAAMIQQKIKRIWGVWVRADEVPATFLPPREPAARNIFLEDDPGSPAAQFILGNLWPSREEPLYYAGMLAARTLQERLTQTLPTSLLTVAAEGRRLSGPFYIQGQAAADQAVGEIDKILVAVEAFKESGITAAEVTKAQDQWIEEFGKTIGTPDGICNLLLDSELYRLGINYLSTFSDFVRRSSPAMVKEAAKRWLFPGGVVLVVRGPASILKQPLETLGTVQLLKR